MDDFKAVRIKKRTLTRFKRFSKRVGKSYSQTLETVMDFFDWHGFSPSDQYGKSLIQEVLKNRKRTEAMIAIIKDIEKTQTLPTNAMILSLFEQEKEEEEESFFEQVERQFSGDESFPDLEETTVPKIRYERLTESFDALKRDFGYVLENVKEVKSSFGKKHYRLELTEDELIKVKRELKKNHLL